MLGLSFHTLNASAISASQTSFNPILKTGIMLGSLVEVDELEITVIVDNEVDVMSAIAPGTVEDTRRFPDIALGEAKKTWVGGTSLNTMPMESICCGAHGLSVMVVSELRFISRCSC